MAQSSRPLVRAAFAAAALLAIATTAASAQSIRGRVLDHATGGAITSGVKLELLNERGRVWLSAAAGPQGHFILVAPSAGTWRVRATHIGYRPVEAQLELDHLEEVIVDLRLAVDAVVLEPLRITARREDTRNAATFDAMLTRHERLRGRTVGGERVVRFDDVEMRNASRVTDVLRWMTPGAGQVALLADELRDGRRAQGTGPREPGRVACMVLFWNGGLVDNEFMVAQMLADPLVTHLEAVEYYRYWAEAPMDYRQYPAYLLLENINNCSVVALWQRRTPDPRYHGEVLPFRARVAAGAGWQHVGGRHAPGSGPTTRAEILWYVSRSLAIGLHARTATSPMAASDLAELTSGRDGIGERDATQRLYGFVTRLDLRERAGVRPFAAARITLAERSFHALRNEDGPRETSEGKGLGVELGVERDLTRHFSLFAAVDHERIAFQPWWGLNLAPEETRETWSTTSLRAGASIHLRK